MKRHLLFLLALILLGVTSKAQTLTSYTTGTTSTTLTGNFVECITVDKFNNKWIGTSNGLSKYDGKGWIIYNKPGQLANVNIYDIKIDNKGNKWLANGKGLYLYNDTTFTLYTVAAGLSLNRLNCLAVDLNDNLWVATENGILSYNGESWTTYTTSNTDGGLLTNKVRTIAIDKEGKKWFGTETGLCSFDNTSWQNFELTQPTSSSQTFSVRYGTTGISEDQLQDMPPSFKSASDSKAISSIAIDIDGSKWLLTKKGVIHFDGKNCELALASTSAAEAKSISIDNQGNKWFSVSLFGVVKYDNKQWIVYNEANGLIDNCPNSIAFDVNGTAWIATDRGMSEFNNYKWKSHKVFDGIYSNDINSFTIDKQGVKWIGAGDRLVKMAGNVMTSYPVFDRIKRKRVIKAITCDAYGEVWSTTGFALHDYIETSSRTYYSSSPLNILTIASDLRGNIWFTTQSGAIYISRAKLSEVQTTVGKYSTHTTFSPPNINEELFLQLNVEANTIAVDSTGWVWLGTKKGVVSTDGEAVRTFSMKNGLPSNEIRKIAIDKQGYKWVATNAGASMFDGTKWTTFGSGNGLASNDVSAIAFDNNGNRWLGTNNGLSMFDGEKWITYTTKEGLASNGILALAVDPGNNLWVGTNSGAMMFDGKIWTSFTVKNTFTALAGDTIMAISVTPQGDVWFVHENGISRFNGTRWFSPFSDFSFDKIYSIELDKANKKWLETSSGIYRFDDKKWIWDNPKDSLLLGATNLMADHKGNLWAKTPPLTFNKFDGKKWTSYNMSNAKPQQSVESIAIDTMGNIWCKDFCSITKFDGVKSNTYELLPFSPFCNAFAVAENGDVWLSNGFNGIIVLSAKNGKFKPIDGVKGEVKEIAFGKDGEVWVGLSKGGLMRYDGKKWTTYKEVNGQPIASIDKLYPNTYGEVWFFSFLRGLYKFSINEK